MAGGPASAGQATPRITTHPSRTAGSPAERFRILQLFNRYRFFGGEESAVLRMTAAMRSSGAQVEECFFASGAWDPPGAPPIWQQAFLALHNPSALERVREMHRHLHSNFWLAHNLVPVLSPSVLREAGKQKVPVALYLHNYRPFSVSGSLWAGDRVAPGGLRKNFMREIVAGAWQGSVPRTAWMALVLYAAHALGWYRRVDCWIAVSNSVRDRFVEAGIPREKTHVLAYPFVASSAPLINARREHFLFLGRLTVTKGVRVLLEAWRIVRARLGDAAPKLVIGGEGELQNEVRAAAEASGGSIIYNGNVGGEAKQDLIARSTAMIVPSIWWDPYPTVVYEAFDQATPVLAARSGGLPESVSSNISGLLHEPGDAAALANDVLQIHHDPHTAEGMGKAGREWLLRNSGTAFWWDRFAGIAEEVQARHAASHQ
jgi:glycosyltransferase involved in cell wall biosynthesis